MLMTESLVLTIPNEAEVVSNKSFGQATLVIYQSRRTLCVLSCRFIFYQQTLEVGWGIKIERVCKRQATAHTPWRSESMHAHVFKPT